MKRKDKFRRSAKTKDSRPDEIWKVDNYGFLYVFIKQAVNFKRNGLKPYQPLKYL